ncbi:AI-2E family transporter [Microbacterium sp. NC79]|uniref:AI-2E family transporter n=1 Tax=Microbacterium sp. NC79 TaxID=2851009 RepID=UPI001C2B9F32|nr:AI-2E family transporter [Microbacterium sp. NC79]MBV0894430.1 AI-2E family transporter [Microbacterium sp. NC79]
MADERRNSRFWDAVRARPQVGDGVNPVPRGLQIATAYSWRLLVIGLAAAGVVFLVIQLKLLVIPLLIALLMSALVSPFFDWLNHRRVPRWLSIVIVMVSTMAIVAGLLWLAIWQIARQLPEVRARTTEGIQAVQQWLADSALQISADDFNTWFAEGLKLLQEQAQALIQGVLAVGSTVGHIATGALLALFILICLLADGAGIWRWTLRLFPKDARPGVDASARAGWKTVRNYARTQLLVATIDAIGIGAVAFGLGVPMAIPVAVLVFLGSFVPFIGAVVTGALAVFLALVYNGPFIALWMLVGVLAVQQVESHLLQPLLMGAAVKVHPLAVVLAVAGGAMIAGIPGALFAVPLAAFANVVAVSLASGSWRDGTVNHADLIWKTVPRERRAR